MELIKYTHANNKQPIYVAKQQVAGLYYSPHHKSTMIVASGGAVLPVEESVDFVRESLLTNSQQQTTKETT